MENLHRNTNEASQIIDLPILNQKADYKDTQKEAQRLQEAKFQLHRLANNPSQQNHQWHDE